MKMLDILHLTGKSVAPNVQTASGQTPFTGPGGGAAAMQVDAANMALASPEGVAIRMTMVKALTLHPIAVKMLRDPEQLGHELVVNVRTANQSGTMDEPFQKYRVNDVDYPGDPPIKPEPGVALPGSTQTIYVAHGSDATMGWRRRS